MANTKGLSGAAHDVQ
jgi:hypothetical protein